MAQSKSRSDQDARILAMAKDGATLGEICEATGKHPNAIYARLSRLGAPPLETKGGRLEKKIRELARKGLTFRQISEQVGRDYHHVCSVARIAKIPVIRERVIQPAKLNHDVAIALYKQGVSGTEIARHFGVSPQRVSQVVIRAGLKRRVGRPSEIKPAAPVSLSGRIS